MQQRVDNIDDLASDDHHHFLLSTALAFLTALTKLSKHVETCDQRGYWDKREYVLRFLDFQILWLMAGFFALR